MPLQVITTNMSGSVRHDSLNGRDYLVVPMVMITEGVHNGSGGGLYYPSEELAKTPEAWNHKPIVVYHPTINGQGVSACDVAVLNSRSVGLIMNTKWDKPKKKRGVVQNVGKLRAEAWIESDRAIIVDNRIMVTLEADEMMEVSTGLFTDMEMTPGEFNGKPYNAIARNYRPDHLALLPDQKGACSIADGAGLLQTNAAGAGQQVEPRYIFAVNEALRRVDKTHATVFNEMSFGQISGALYTALKEAVDPSSDYSCWVEEVYAGYFVYYCEGKLYQQDYHSNDSGVSLVGDPAEVVRVVSYEKATTTNAVVLNKNKEIVMTKDQKVAHLIANGWTETDKPFLESCNDVQLDKMMKQAPAPVANVATAPAAPVVVPAAPVVNAAAPAAPVVAAPLTAAQYIANAPAEVQQVLQSALNAQNAQKAKLVAVLVANANCAFSEATLNTKDVEELTALAQLAAGGQQTVQNSGGAAEGESRFRSTPNYFGAQGAPVVNAGAPVTEEPMTPVVMNYSK